jgi:hypothetical protein
MWAELWTLQRERGKPGMWYVRCTLKQKRQKRTKLRGYRDIASMLGQRQKGPSPKEEEPPKIGSFVWVRQNK